MKKKVIFIVSICCVLIVFSCLAFKPNHQPFKFSEFCGASIEDVTKINIMNGNTGEITAITDSTKIQEIIASLSNIEYTKVSQEDTTGWSYKVEIITDELDTSIIFVCDTLCTIDGNYYSIESNITSDLKGFISE